MEQHFRRLERKSLIALLILVIIGVIGFTLAYFSDSITIGNEFKTKEYGTSVTEVFKSPDNWTPGTTTEKSVVATNTGNVDEAVRISYTEKWVAGDNTTVLSGWVDENGNVTNHAEELATDERAAIINFDNESDWTLSNGYYYYNYKLAPTESTSSLIESVTFNSLVTSDSECKTVENTTTCTSTKKGYDGATYTLTFTIESVQYDQYKNAWNTENVDIVSEKPATKILRDKANGVSVTNYADGNTGEMYTFKHHATEQTGPLTDYRYIGDSPNNYVNFNCDENEENCETWRIIGVFSVDDGTGKIEQRIKLVRGELLTDSMPWNANYVNEWSTATLNTYLNDDYYNDLSDSSKPMIGDAKYYLGGRKYDFTTRYGSTEDIYDWERGTEVFDPSTDEYNCNYTVTESGMCARRSTSWTGKVALLYPSDYGYTYANGVEKECFDDPAMCYEREAGPSREAVNNHPESGWIYNSNVKKDESESLLSPYPGHPYYSFHVENGYLECYGHGYIFIQRNIRPVVYLTSDVKITGGDGSSSNPYKLSK